MKKTKIICTIGPAVDEPAVLEKLMLAGMDVIFCCIIYINTLLGYKEVLSMENTNQKHLTLEDRNYIEDVF